MNAKPESCSLKHFIQSHGYKILFKVAKEAWWMWFPDFVLYCFFPSKKLPLPTPLICYRLQQFADFREHMSVVSLVSTAPSFQRLLWYLPFSHPQSMWCEMGHPSYIYFNQTSHKCWLQQLVLGQNKHEINTFYQVELSETLQEFPVDLGFVNICHQSSRSHATIERLPAQ